MTTISIDFLRRFCRSLAFSALTLGIFIPSGTVNAGGFKKLADANNAVYREIRDLGNMATPGRIAEIQNRNFGPAMAELNADHYAKYLDWKKAIKANATETKEEIARILGKKFDPKMAGEKGGGKAASAEEAPKIQAGRTGASSHTGDQGGEGGAKEATFGGKREEKKPSVNEDGIIMSQ